MALCLLPVLVFAGGWIGGRLSVPLSKMHRTVQLAERIAAEDAGKVTPPANTQASAGALDKKEKNKELTSKAFRQTGNSTTELFAQALQKRGEFVTGGWLLGAFVGLVIGGKLVSLSRPQKRSIYEPDRALCLACGRCYSYCPKELVKVKRAQKDKINALATAK